MKQTDRDVNAGRKLVSQWAVSRVAMWIASGYPERPAEHELPYYMVEERETLEACLLELADV